MRGFITYAFLMLSYLLLRAILYGLSRWYLASLEGLGLVTVDKLIDFEFRTFEGMGSKFTSHASFQITHD